MISIIAAVDQKNGIGYKNGLPWPKLPADFKQFKEKTVGKTVVMGRKTFESMGSRPLPNRANIVLTKNPEFKSEGIEIATSIESIVGKAKTSEVMILGGVELFKTFIPLADRIYLTFVDGTFPADVFFPFSEMTDWKEMSRQRHEKDEKNPYSMDFVLYERM